MTAKWFALMGGALAAVAAPLALGFYVAARVIEPPRPRKRDVRLFGTTEVDGVACLVLQRSQRTIKAGTYSVWFDGGHAQVGEVLRSDATTVTRELVRVDDGDVERAIVGSWSGYVYISAAALGLEAQAVEIDTEVGVAPAWRIDPAERVDASTWAIHIHGQGSSRSGTLRGVKVATQAGLPSLVVSYRNDGEGPVFAMGRSTLGMDEATDVARAVEYAIEQGARRIVLFGWSMGANIAFALATDRRYKALIKGVIGISPVLEWRRTIVANCRRARVPALVGIVASVLLRWRPTALGLGLPHPIDLKSLNWLARGRLKGVTTLLIHGTEDWSTPIESSRALSVVLDSSTLVEFDGGHTLEWNVDPERWERSVSTWLADAVGCN